MLIRGGKGENPDLLSDGVPRMGGSCWRGPILELAFGLGVVGLTGISTRHFQWARDLHGSFRDLLGPLTGHEIVILALASSIGEELLFRGALLPWMGIWLQAVVFALLHVGPGKRFLPWTVSALVLGIAFGWLAAWTGSLGAPIAAHFAINFFNLRHIVKTALRASGQQAA